MTDKELIELAAKAAGIAILRPRLDNPICADMLLAERTDDGHAIGWNPLTDDGDALRLAVKLGFHIYQPTDIAVVTVARNDKNLAWSQSIDGDALKATRFAIVKLAAQIEKEKDE